MSGHDWIIAALLWPATALCLISSLGLVVMRDPYQRLHFVAPPALLAAPIIALAVFIDGGLIAGFKATLVAALLAAMNGVATHVTARAARVRERGSWDQAIDGAVRIVGQERTP